MKRPSEIPLRRTWEARKGQMRYKLRGLFPADFLTSYFPFQLYKLTDEKPKIPERKIVWGNKPEEVVEEEKLTDIMKFTMLSLGVVSPKILHLSDYKPSEKQVLPFEKIDDGLYAIIVGKIWELTFGIPGRIELSKWQVHDIYARAKMTFQEPWSFFSGNCAPEMFNPERYCFNKFILLEGLKYENELYEKAKLEAETDARRRG